MTAVSVYRFPAPAAAPITTDLEGWTKREGSPSMKTWIQHTSADGTVICTIQRCCHRCSRLGQLLEYHFNSSDFGKQPLSYLQIVF